MKSTTAKKGTWDLELIGQRILTLAELSVAEHIESLARSQADGLLKMVDDLGMRESAGAAGRGEGR